MSRNPRQYPKPEIVPDEPLSEPLGDGGATVHRLTGKLNDMLEAIVSGCAIVDDVAATLPPFGGAVDKALQQLDLAALDDLPGDSELLDEELDDDDDLTGEEIVAGMGELGEAFGGITLTTRVLARGLLSRALNRQPETSSWLNPSAGSAGGGDEARLLDDLTRTLLPANLPKPMRLSRADRREAFEEAASLIREVGLEEFDMSCDLATRDGGTELFAYPLSPEGAHIALLEYLFHRAEAEAEDLDPFLAVERDASFWEFSRWSVSPPPGHMLVEVNEFPRTVREQEYSLVERSTITLGTPVIAELANDVGFAELFPRQHRLATALTESFVDVFECMALEGSRATMRSLTGGRTFQVHEHMKPIQYVPGWIAAGRLLPFDDDTYLRSPGMLFFKPHDPADMQSSARAFDGIRAGMSPALAIEAFISSAMFGVAVPREVKPARSRADARTLLAMIDAIVADAELDRESPSSEMYYVPGHHMESSSPRAGGVRLDETVQTYVAALDQQATGGGQGRQQRPRTPKRKGKRRR
ncbi:MAG: hypothetical protein K0S86_1374 [Geminicoccaceae bacterium]|nr:hypothetical protein [Geminicoccaceae bacterium]